MTIVEAVGEGFLYRWPGGEVHLEPGKPVSLPDERAQRLLLKAPGKVRVIHRTIRPGDHIAWTRGDGSPASGLVDFLHVDESGVHWAFVTLGTTWAAVNLKVVELVKESR